MAVEFLREKNLCRWSFCIEIDEEYSVGTVVNVVTKQEREEEKKLFTHTHTRESSFCSHKEPLLSFSALFLRGPLFFCMCLSVCLARGLQCLWLYCFLLFYSLSDHSVKDKTTRLETATSQRKCRHKNLSQLQ